MEMAADGVTDSPAAWRRLALAVVASAIGGVGMWSVVVVLPAVEAEFGVARAGAALPYSLTMIGFAFGGVLMGRLADRFGVAVPLALGAVALALGYVLSAFATGIVEFAAIQGLLIGMLGASASFSPLLADITHWFERRRGFAVAICASGSYLAGTAWPPVVQHFVSTAGWRATHVGIGIFCLVTLLPLAIAMRRRVGVGPAIGAGAAPGGALAAGAGLSPRALQALLVVAGLACCVAMAMPQVHIVAYCGDLGYGAARGAEMLSLMLGFGIISRIASGWVADRIGGLSTLLLGSTLQGVALFLYLWFDGLTSLYVISALFGLFQGGIVPSYALVVREFFPPGEAGTRVGVVIMATLFGMALGGWMSGLIFDVTGSYGAAFVNGLGWNLLNVSIAAWLLQRRRRILARPDEVTS
ncbi:MFS transporter [Arenibaculum pallidiluteum]|uniref:MFS transporter n=1 Tax=Arenibaculum pallidiluteum TaxID=2812559 RepID=UPI001F3B18A7|nr:MFS transporter [Arenibaculum pallidiluteum]